MTEENKYQGKFVVVWDTIVDGNQTMKDGEDKPVLFDSHDEAFEEIFDGALSMFRNYSEEEIKEYDEEITPELVKEMERVHGTGNVKLMKEFLDKHENMNYNNEWVEKADEFIAGRKAIFTGKGVEITGEKLK